MATIDKPSPWYHAAPVHGILIVGAVFFVLPLIWMIATSFKPLDQTMRIPGTVSEALLAKGHRATIDGMEHDVTLERPIAPSPPVVSITACRLARGSASMSPRPGTRKPASGSLAATDLMHHT